MLFLIQDVNDIPPVFTSVPRPITLDDDIPIGTTVINLIATDSDGTAPGNQVRSINTRMTDLNHDNHRFIPLTRDHSIYPTFYLRFESILGSRSARLDRSLTNSRVIR